jgi:predicted histidine transporter YuiF (NhaC family)
MVFDGGYQAQAPACRPLFRLAAALVAAGSPASTSTRGPATRRRPIFAASLC